MLPVDPQILMYVLSAIASTGKIIETAFSFFDRGFTDVDYNSVKAEAAKDVANAITTDDIDIINVLAATIPPNILEAVHKGIDALDQSIADTLNNRGMDRIQKQDKMSNDRNSICWYMSQLSRYGKIPDSLLSRWKVLKCADYDFTLENE